MSEKKTKYPYRLYDKDFCCVFCSHGEYAEVREFSGDKEVISGYFLLKYTLACPFCEAEYPIYSRIDKYHDIDDSEVLDKAMDVFLKYVEFNRGKEEFIIARTPKNS